MSDKPPTKADVEEALSLLLAVVHAFGDLERRQTVRDLHATLRDYIAWLEGALERLSDPETFTDPFFIPNNAAGRELRNAAGRELRARMDFARGVLDRDA